MKTSKLSVLGLAVLFGFNLAGFAADELAWLDQYNVAWDSQSRNSGESMPCGGGDIGLNVWVENGDLLFYIGRSGSFEENGALFKSGRIRVRLTPNPFADGGSFRQELKLKDGYVEIQGRKGDLSATVRVWVEVKRPVIHVDMNSSAPVVTEAIYENWRMKPAFYGEINWTGAGRTPQTVPDLVCVTNNSVEFCHRNSSTGLFDALVTLQELDAVKSQLWNPLSNLTFGGRLQGDGMVAGPGQLPQQGTYAGLGYSAWSLVTPKAVKRQALQVVLHTAQVPTMDAWRVGLAGLASRVKGCDAEDATHAWWHSYWARSRVVISDSRTNSSAWQVGRNYQLFRYLLGCNAYGEQPTKFNGGLFTFDSCYINFLGNEPPRGHPDMRGWGGVNFTGQNQRLVYWPMLKSGDFDMMRPQFLFYAGKPAINAGLRTQVYWGHAGVSYLDQGDMFGLPSCYGWVRPPGYERGISCIHEGKSNQLHAHYYSSQIEFAWMILEFFRYGGGDISEYMSYVENAVRFFDEHYRMRQRNLTGQPLDEHGKLVIYPSKALESYDDVRNPTDVVTGLKVVLERLLELPATLVSNEKKAYFRDFLGHLPEPVYFAEVSGKKILTPGEKYGKRTNGETPQLYVLFPYSTYGIGRPDFQTALDSYVLGWGPGIYNDKGWWCWYQNNIFAARLGLVDEARYHTIAKLSDSGRRFPAFWGPFFDMCPDMDGAGAGMVGLQDMLFQEKGDDLYLLPAWPKEWISDFKLHAPLQTVIEGQAHSGMLTRLTVAVNGPGRERIRLHVSGVGSARVTAGWMSSVDAKVVDKDTLEFPVKQGKTYSVKLPGMASDVHQTVQEPVLTESFGGIKVPLSKTPNKPGVWQKASFDAEPAFEVLPVAGTNGMAFKTTPRTVISYDLGRKVRGIVTVRAYVESPAAACGTVEILNGDVNDMSYLKTVEINGQGKGIKFDQVYRGVMVGLSGQGSWGCYAQGVQAGVDQFMGQTLSWQGLGLPGSVGWVEISIDGTQEGYVTVSVKDLVSGRREQLRVKAVEFINGFRFIRLGNYMDAGTPVYFDDLSVVELCGRSKTSEKK